MIAAIPFLFLLTVGDQRDEPTVTIGPCTAVDADKVRALVKMELETSHATPDNTWEGTLHVVVDCDAQPSRISLLANGGGELAARTVNLYPPVSAGRDAANRELALAIAELVRRGGAQPVTPPTAVPVAPTQRDDATVAQVSVTSRPTLPPTTAISWPWRLQVGALFSWDRWTNGQSQMGPDVDARFRIVGGLSLELRLGGRRIDPIVGSSGRLSASGAAASLAVGWDLLPKSWRASLAIVARGRADWMAYGITHDSDGSMSSGSATAIGILGGPLLSIGLKGPWRAVAEVTAGRTLHTVTVVDAGTRVAALAGLETAIAGGLMVQF